MLKFASLGSGSAGNATLVRSEEALILLDCGFAIKEVQRRLARLGVCPEDITAILLTHEHSDHAKGVAPLARKYKIPVHMTEGTLASRDFGALPQLTAIRHYQPFQIADLHIQPVVVPHDAREPAQFVFSSATGEKLGILTDLGSVTPLVEKAYTGCHGLLIEANHDLEMLAMGPYPASVKARVASHWGHLNNLQAARFLTHYAVERLQQLVVGHISLTNNSLAHVKSALGDIVQRAPSLHFACQEQGFDWLSLTATDEIL